MGTRNHDNLLVALALAVFAVALAAFLLSYPGILVTRSYNSSATTTQVASCQYGYACNIPSDGCAAPGAVYNCPAIIVSINQSSNYTIAVNLSQELNNSANEGFTLNQSVFYANSSSLCSRQLISACDNNVPDQFICINQNYSGEVAAQYMHAHSSPVACPQFLLSGSVSCAIQAGYCVVTRSAQSQP